MEPLLAFNRIFAGLAGRAGEPDRLMIISTHFRTYSITTSLIRMGINVHVGLAVSSAPSAT